MPAAETQDYVTYFSSQFTLLNTGTTPAQFTLKINTDGPYENLQDLRRAVLEYPDEFPGEPLYRKAWRFVKNNNKHFIPLDASVNQDRALLYLNSVGFGFCSDVATALDYVWTLLGYQSRVWFLNGHVVPEVYADGAWHMLDPDLRVYYLDSQGQIASVTELEADPSLITSPLQVLQDVASNAYSNTVAEIYASTDNNAIYYPQMPLENFNLLWTLPPGASLTMPLPVPEIQTTQGMFAGSEADAHIAVLKIPAGWQGELAIPLVVYDITGSGAITITDSIGETNSFTIGSAALESYINARTSAGAPYFDQLNIAASGDVEVSYFVNTKIMDLTADNRLDIQGTHVANLLIN